MESRVKWSDDERADKPDLQAMVDLPDAAIRRLVRLIGEPRTTASDDAAVTGCVVKPSGVTFDGADAVVGDGLEVLLASRDGALGEAPYGEAYLLAAPVTVAGAATTALVPAKVIMARPAGDADAEQDDRVYYDALAASKQKVLPTWTRRARVLSDWAWYATTDTVGIGAAQAAGYQKVALLGWTGAAPALTSWYTVLPTITNTARFPGGALLSIVQGLAAMATVLGRVVGSGSDAGKWDDNLQTNAYGQPGSLYRVNAVVAVHKALLDDFETRVAALEGLLVRPTCIATLAEFTIANDTVTVIEWEAAPTNIGSMWDDAGDKTLLTVPTTRKGPYTVHATCEWDTTTDISGRVEVYLYHTRERSLPTPYAESAPIAQAQILVPAGTSLGVQAVTISGMAVPDDTWETETFTLVVRQVASNSGDRVFRNFRIAATRN